MRTLAGIHTVLYALFDRDGRVDRAAMRQQVNLCVAAGAHGVVALGLATEVGKLSETERHALIDWVADYVEGRVPLGFTITGGSVAEQVAQIRRAEAAGADWVILQPPLVGQYGAAEYVSFFGRVAEATDLPVAIQNAPGYLGRGLTADEIGALLDRHANVTLLKAEAPAVEVAALIATVGRRLAVFNGRGGLELTDNLRVGCAGMLLAPELLDLALLAHARLREGDEAGAEDAYARMLPAVVFVMQSIENLICYGKRLFGLRAGIEIHDRAPALRPTAAGEAILARLARRLGPLG